MQLVIRIIIISSITFLIIDAIYLILAILFEKIGRYKWARYVWSMLYVNLPIRAIDNKIHACCCAVGTDCKTENCKCWSCTDYCKYKVRNKKNEHNNNHL